MKSEINLFLRDFCEATEIDSDKANPFPLEYRIRKNLMGLPGWAFWIRFSSYFTMCKITCWFPEDSESLAETSPQLTKNLSVADVLSKISTIVNQYKERASRF